MLQVWSPLALPSGVELRLSFAARAVPAPTAGAASSSSFALHAAAAQHRLDFRFWVTWRELPTTTTSYVGGGDRSGGWRLFCESWFEARTSFTTRAPSARSCQACSSAAASLFEAYPCLLTAAASPAPQDTPSTGNAFLDAVSWRRAQPAHAPRFPCAHGFPPHATPLSPAARVLFDCSCPRL